MFEELGWVLKHASPPFVPLKLFYLFEVIKFPSENVYLVNICRFNASGARKVSWFISAHFMQKCHLVGHLQKPSMGREEQQMSFM